MPIVRDPVDPKISLWYMLAHRLRWERERQGLSLTQWGKIIGAARSTVSNIEAGRRKIDEDQAVTIDGRFDTGRLFELLLWFARTAHDPDWLRSFTGYEAAALVIRIYQGQVIPGPLQTEAYARALLLAGSSRDVEEAVAARMARQKKILHRSEPPFVWVLLDESVLEDCIGGPEVMRAQLKHVLELMESPDISVRIIPRSSGAHLGLDGPFRIFTLDSRDVAYAGARRGGRLIEAPGEVGELRMDFDRIGLKAAADDASRVMIEQALEAIK